MKYLVHEGRHGRDNRKLDADNGISLYYPKNGHGQEVVKWDLLLVIWTSQVFSPN